MFLVLSIHHIYLELQVSAFVCEYIQYMTENPDSERPSNLQRINKSPGRFVMISSLIEIRLLLQFTAADVKGGKWLISGENNQF